MSLSRYQRGQIAILTNTNNQEPQSSIQQLSLANPQFTHKQQLSDHPLFTMCYGSHRLPPFSGDGTTASTVTAPPVTAVTTAAVDGLRLRLAETEARLQRARAREAELTKKLLEMKRFVSVMEILESYLKRRFIDQQQQLAHLVSQSPVPK